MKKIILPALAALTLTACLSEDPRDRIDEDQTFNSAITLYLNTVGNLYHYIGGNNDSEGLQGTARGIYDINTFTTDEAILPTRGGDWYDGGLWLSLYWHTFSPGTQPIEGAWNYLYKVIVMCNQSLDLIQRHNDLLTSQQEAIFTSEVRALRAIYYYYLLDLFGSVPYVRTATTSLEQAEQVSRSTLFKNVWDALINALPNLANERSNWEGEYYGRITRHVAWFVLAKMALNAEIWMDDNWTDEVRPDGRNIMLDCEGKQLNAWDACIYWCEKLTAAGYQLEDSYATNFAVYNEDSKENIFTIPMDKDLYTNQFVYLFRSRHNNHGAALGMAAEDGTCATVSSVLTYGYGTPDQDNRYSINLYSDTLYLDGHVVLLDNGEPLVYQPLHVMPILTGLPFEKTAGARMKKYETDRTAYLDGKLQDNDIVLFRYADVLLMEAEAKVRNGQDGSREFNKVRKRAGMEEREATLNNILNERLMELHWEGWRRQDLVRFDRFHLQYDQRPQLSTEDDRHTTVFPIPGRAIALNSRLVQNPGY